jgi:Protein of unknown function (DUF1440)
MRRNGSVGSDLVKGAIAGAVATWVMGRTTASLYESEDESARRREDQARDGKTSYGVAAEKSAALVGRSLSDEEREQAGQALHWLLGIGAGATYAVLRRRAATFGRGAGLVFGTGFWLLLDEVMVPLLGLTPGPTAFPWQAHARGLAGHLSFGVVADAALSAMDRVA